MPASAAPSAGRLRRWLSAFVTAMLAGVVAVVAVLAYVVYVDNGTRDAWRVAVWAMRGKLAGTYAGGNLAEGVRLRDIRYRDAALHLEIDRIDSSWRLSLAQRRFSVAYLRVGTVDINKQPTPPAPTVLPASLSLPLALDLHDLALHKLRVQQGTTVTELGNLQLHGTSDGVQHTLVLDQLSTAFGQATASLRLNGRQPFAISGGVQLAGADTQEKSAETFALAAQLSGSLQALGIALTASGDRLNGTADILATPFATIPLKKARIDVQHLNPRAFNRSAPQADLHLRADLAARPAASSAPDELRVTGMVNIVNAMAGTLDQQRMPLISAHAQVDLGYAQQDLSDVRITLLQNARISGAGHFRPSDRTGAFHFQLTGLDLHALHRQLKPTKLQGPLTVNLTPDAQHVTLRLADATYDIALDSTLAASKITVHQARLGAAGALLDLTGTLATVDRMDYAFTGRLSNFNPALWLQTGPPAGKSSRRSGVAGQAVPARINMRFDASGSLSPELQGKLTFGMRDSVYNALPMSGGGTLQWQGKRLLPSNVDVRIAGNQLRLKGAFGAASDRLDLHIDAPQLERLGYGLAGQLALAGHLTGTAQRPNLRLSYNAKQLSFGAHHLDQLGGQAELQNDLNAGVASAHNRLMLDLHGEGYRGPDATLRQLKLALSGTYGDHRLTLQADGKLQQHVLALQFAAQGKLTANAGAYGWDGVINTLENHGLPRLSLGSPLRLRAAAGIFHAGATQLQIDNMAIDLHHLDYQHGRIDSAGQAKAIDVGRLLDLARELTGITPPLKSDLVLDAEWHVALAETARGFIRLARQSGDVSVNTGSAQAALGLSALQLRIDLSGQQAKLDGRLAASRVGSLDLKGLTVFQQRDGVLTLSPDSALTAHARLTVPDANTVGPLLGPQYRLNGSLGMELMLAGTVARPRLSGAINGDALAVTLLDQGVQLKDGVVRIVMDDNVIDLRQIAFRGGSGTLRAAGKVRLGAADPDLSATIVADRLQLFASLDRQLMLSGQARLSNVQEQMRIDGKFVVDKALFDLPKSSAPKLGDDVVIVRKNGNATAGGAASVKETLTAATEKPAGRFAPTIAIQVDLGRDFRFNGGGADLRLQGDMSVHSEPYQPLRAAGTVQVAEGVYEAFGTKLNIERGIITFQGPISNPNLNILAMRRNQDVEAGVEVTGNANLPHVRLVSEPTVPDGEKLSWMMFGHGSENSGLGQRSASSQALAILGNYGGRKIAKDIGLDQFSIGGSESGLGDEQVVNLGKAISEKLAIGYEQSLTSAASIAKATWQLSRRWSAVVRTGTINGMNILFNSRYD